MYYKLQKFRNTYICISITSYDAVQSETVLRMIVSSSLIVFVPVTTAQRRAQHVFGTKNISTCLARPSSASG